MKVLLVLTYYHPYWTGLSQYAKTIAEAYTKNGHDVTVLTTAHEKNLLPEEIVNGVRVIRCATLFRVSRSMVSVAFLWRLIREIQSNDRIVVFLPLAEILYVSLLVAVLGKKLYLVHNGDLVLPNGAIKPILEWIYYFTTDIACRVAKNIVVHTEDYAKQSRLLAPYAKKWRVILTPIQLSLPSPAAVVRIKKQIGKSKYIVGFAGRFVEEKGFDILFAAIPYVVAKIPNVQFVFAGETHMVYETFFERQKQTRETLSPWLVFLGRLDRDEMAGFYSVLDAFVISSRSDCFPTTQMEAMLAGVPIVVTNIPGARWPVLQTGMGIVVPTEHPNALAEAIVDMLTQPKKYHVSPQAVQRLFDFNASIHAYETLIQN